MEIETEELVSDLNTLIALCKDGEKGYRTVAQVIEAPTYRSLFEEYAAQRNRFASELQTEVTQLGGIPGKEGDLAGTVHRSWINLKAALSGRNVAAILGECDAGEKAAIYGYAEVLEKELPAALYRIVDRQYQAIKAARARIQALAAQLD